MDASIKNIDTILVKLGIL